MDNASPHRRLSFEQAGLIAVGATVVLAGIGRHALSGPRPDPAALALCYLGVATGALALPLPDGRWRARRDGMRVGLAWVVVVALGVGLCAPIVYRLPVAVALAIEAPWLLLFLIALIAAHVAVLRRAKERRAALALGDIAAWETGSVVPVTLLLLVFLMPRYDPSAELHRPWPRLPVAVSALRELHACARRWTAEHDGTPPPNLATLGAAKVPCIDGGIARGNVAGWTVEYLPDPARPAGFAVVAREPRTRDGAYHSVASDESGALHYREYSADADASSPFLTRIPGELRRIDRCIEQLSASRAGALPQTLGELGPHGAHCEPLDSAQWNADSSAVVAIEISSEDHADERYRLGYSLVADSAGHAVPRIEARPDPYPANGVRSYLLVNGQLHGTGDDRPATIADPVVDECEERRPQRCADPGSLIFHYLGPNRPFPATPR